MILTVTLNASLDTTYVVDRFGAGGIHRAREVVRAAGGKGNNVARVLAALGKPVTATGFVGGATGDAIRADLTRLGIVDAFLAIPGESRTCVTIVDPALGTQTEIREPGPAIGPQEQEAFLRRFDQLLRGVRLVVFSGSLPPGVPADFYAALIVRARQAGVPSILDSSGEAFRAGVAARPYAALPNLDELSEWSRRPLQDDRSVTGALAELASAGPELAAVTLGPRGLIACHGGRTWTIRPPRVAAVNSVGSGDALVAGLAAGLLEGRDVPGALALGVACGAANALTPWVAEIRPEDVETLLPRVVVDPTHLCSGT